MVLATRSSIGLRVSHRNGLKSRILGNLVSDGIRQPRGSPVLSTSAIRVARDAQRLLSPAGFPCAVPLAGPDDVERRILTV